MAKEITRTFLVSARGVNGAIAFTEIDSSLRFSYIGADEIGDTITKSVMDVAVKNCEQCNFEEFKGKLQVSIKVIDD